VLEGVRDSVYELKWHPDYEEYVTFFLLLDSMADIVSLPIEIASSAAGAAGASTESTRTMNALIPIAIREIILTLISTEKGRNAIMPLFDSVKKEFDLYPLVASAIGYNLIGTFLEYDQNLNNIEDHAIEVVQHEETKKFMAQVIEKFKTKDTTPFYTEGNKDQTDLSKCNHNIQGFLAKVNDLQKRLGEDIFSAELEVVEAPAPVEAAAETAGVAAGAVTSALAKQSNLSVNTGASSTFAKGFESPNNNDNDQRGAAAGAAAGAPASNLIRSASNTRAAFASEPFIAPASFAKRTSRDSRFASFMISSVVTVLPS